jgi:hypothetical protein
VWKYGIAYCLGGFNFLNSSRMSYLAQAYTLIAVML